MTLPHVVIVIVTFNSADDIGDCLRSIEQHTTVDHTVVVVDNASSDGTADLVSTTHPGVELVRNDENRGFAAGVNIGAAQRSGRYLLLLNPDTELRPNAVDELVRVAQANPDHRIYGGLAIGPAGELDRLSAWGLPSMWGLVCFALGLTTVFKGSRLFDRESLGWQDRAAQREVPAVSGCLQLIDRALWDELGGMDEAYFMYGEDADWAIRARAAGARPLLVPSAEIIHTVGASSSPADKRVAVMRGKVTVLRRHWGPLRARLGVTLLVTGTLLRGPIANVTRRALRRRSDESWAATWRRRKEWVLGW